MDRSNVYKRPLKNTNVAIHPYIARPMIKSIALIMMDVISGTFFIRVNYNVFKLDSYALKKKKVNTDAYDIEHLKNIDILACLLSCRG